MDNPGAIPQNNPEHGRVPLGLQATGGGRSRSAPSGTRATRASSRPVRAETFWSYYRGMNPLFDDLFAGRGIFLCQQVATEGDAKKVRKFWAGIWSGIMRIFGL